MVAVTVWARLAFLQAKTPCFDIIHGTRLALMYLQPHQLVIMHGVFRKPANIRVETIGLCTPESHVTQTARPWFCTWLTAPQRAAGGTHGRCASELGTVSTPETSPAADTYLFGSPTQVCIATWASPREWGMLSTHPVVGRPWGITREWGMLCTPPLARYGRRFSRRCTPHGVGVAGVGVGLPCAPPSFDYEGDSAAGACP